MSRLIPACQGHEEKSPAREGPGKKRREALRELGEPAPTRRTALIRSAWGEAVGRGIDLYEAVMRPLSGAPENNPPSDGPCCNPGHLPHS